MLFYNARYYDPGIGRFVSADSVVPGNASGGLDGIALKPLTVDFHEPGFVSGLAKENRGGGEKLNRMGPQDPQSLNRYSYVLNNPMRYTDPNGHWVVTIGFNFTAGAGLGSVTTVGFTFDEQGVAKGFVTTTKSTPEGLPRGIAGSANAGMSVSIGLFPTAPSYNTAGDGLVIGGSGPLPVRAPVSGGAEYVASTTSEGTVTYDGFDVSVGVGAGQLPIEVHGFATYTTIMEPQEWDSSILYP